MNVEIINKDCIEAMKEMEPQSVQCVVTSPPYFGLRDYGQDGQIGLEETPAAYIDKLVSVFREVRRVLRDDGTVWLNIGDSYARTGGTDRRESSTAIVGSTKNTLKQMSDRTRKATELGAKHKDLLMIPARVALALQADGWYLRSDVIWLKPNPMPESVKDRPTSAHEHIFMLTKSARYFYDSKAVREKGTGRTDVGPNPKGRMGACATVDRFARRERVQEGRNLRNVWNISIRPYPGAHFAVFPPELPERCIKAGSSEGDTILDPFAGAGTTGLAADRLGRKAKLIELSADYCEIAKDRLQKDREKRKVDA